MTTLQSARERAATHTFTELASDGLYPGMTRLAVGTRAFACMGTGDEVRAALVGRSEQPMEAQDGL